MIALQNGYECSLLLPSLLLEHRTPWAIIWQFGIKSCYSYTIVSITDIIFLLLRLRLAKLMKISQFLNNLIWWFHGWIRHILIRRTQCNKFFKAKGMCFEAAALKKFDKNSKMWSTHKFLAFMENGWPLYRTDCNIVFYYPKK